MDTEPTDRSPSDAVLAAVAEAEGVDEADLTPPLYEAIDPEALDTLVRAGGGTLEFQYHGYTVAVDHEGAASLEAVASGR